MNKNIEFLVSIFISNLLIVPIYIYIISKKRSDKGKPKTLLIKQIVPLIFVIYIVSLIAITIIPLPFSKVGSPYLNLDLFHQTYNNYRSAINHTSGRTIWNETENLLGNIVLFVPLGFFLPLFNTWFRNIFILLFTAACCSFIIEALQYLISIKWGYNRIADIDDFVLNTMGALIGYIGYRILIIIKKLFKN